jgi:hypothetical protein
MVFFRDGCGCVVAWLWARVESERTPATVATPLPRPHHPYAVAGVDHLNAFATSAAAPSEIMTTVTRPASSSQMLASHLPPSSL